MVTACEDNLFSQRDRALLLLGCAMALRRSEFVAIDIANLQIVSEGARMTIRHSKTDEEAAGEMNGVVRIASVLCLLAAVQAWLSAAGITEGRLFRRINRHGHPGAALSGQGRQSAAPWWYPAHLGVGGLERRALRGRALALQAGADTSAAPLWRRCWVR
jgi:hypothetical protein